MLLTSIFKTFITRLPTGSLLQNKEISTAKFPLQFIASPILWAEPLKAKKKIDPAIIKAREERKKRKVEKLIKKRLKLDKQLKPIYENEVPICLMSDSKSREREVKIPEEVLENRIKLFKKWCAHRLREKKSDILLIHRLIYAQQMALNELRLESEELYQAAVKIDAKLIPLEYAGPTETPQLETYSMPDGEYLDISKKWT